MTASAPLARFSNTAELDTRRLVVEARVAEKFVEVPLVAKNLVRVVEAEKKLVVVELPKVFPPVQVLKSARSVVEAVLSVEVMVMGVEPNTVKAVHEVAPEHEAEVVAVA